MRVFFKLAESGALEKEFAKKGVKCTPYIPKDPSFFSVIVRGASKPTLLKGHISDAFLESVRAVLVFLRLLEPCDYIYQCCGNSCHL